MGKRPTVKYPALLINKWGAQVGEAKRPLTEHQGTCWALALPLRGWVKNKHPI